MRENREKRKKKWISLSFFRYHGLSLSTPHPYRLLHFRRIIGYHFPASSVGPPVFSFPTNSRCQSIKRKKSFDWIKEKRPPDTLFINKQDYTCKVVSLSLELHVKRGEVIIAKFRRSCVGDLFYRLLHSISSAAATIVFCVFFVVSFLLQLLMIAPVVEHGEENAPR